MRILTTVLTAFMLWGCEADSGPPCIRWAPRGPCLTQMQPPYGGKDDSAQTRDDVPSNTVFGDNARGFGLNSGFGDYSMKDVNSMSELEHACVLLEMELFGKIPKSDVMGYGIGDNELRVYLFDDGHTTRVPKNFMGFPVKVEVTGAIVAI